MTLEIALLKIKPGTAAEFLDAFSEAERILAGASGYLSHELNRCIEHPDVFVLLVRWKTMEDHVPGFRNSPGYQQWRALLHHFFDRVPEVLHYQAPDLAPAMSAS